ncbi:Uncharacterized protein APZ42_027611 [Daphnia magna]|uniref:Uncharacterized protein n=1 Tax=Daphnia magna TaxID=35525 RepID=A0A164R817_9CRUS|nr:Uncharacterized protein APZ42_027611 [Daphnia magna]
MQKFIEELDAKLQAKVKYKEFKDFNELVAATRVYALRLEKFLSHNHLILVWDKTYTLKSQHTLQIVESGTGTLTKKLGAEKYFRLLDDRRQLDFHLTPQPPCVPIQQHCSNRTTVFTIVGQSKLSLITAAIMEKFPPITVETSTPSSAEDLDKAANKQYNQDRVTDRENELGRMIQRLECDARKAKHERAIAAAPYNGWLAASHLKLPQCTKLQAFGQTAVVIKFKYSRCYWTNGFVNFNDKPYAFRNNTWKRVDANMVLPEQTLAHSFRYDDVKFFHYEHRTNPAYNDNLLNHMNVMADIRTAMNEHPPTEFSLIPLPSASSVLVTASGKIHYTSCWETIKMWFFISIFCILGLLSNRRGTYVQQVGVITENFRLYGEARKDDATTRANSQRDPAHSAAWYHSSRRSQPTSERNSHHERPTLHLTSEPSVSSSSGHAGSLQSQLPSVSGARESSSRASSRHIPQHDSRHSRSGRQTRAPKPTPRSSTSRELAEAERALKKLTFVEEEKDLGSRIEDLYREGGLQLPQWIEHGSRSTIKAEFDDFHGQALEWFTWIDLFRVLVHDTTRAVTEKLAILKRHLRKECADMVHGLGGGETAYVEALTRLKETYGRRDVMRTALILALDKLEMGKQDANSFRRFAEKTRTYLFDLNRIGETTTVDIIERVCLKLQLPDHLAWNEERVDGQEKRNLLTFGRWLCKRAAAYQNAHSLATELLTIPPAKPPNKHTARTHSTNIKFGRKGGASESGGKPGGDKIFCFQCEGSHRLEVCGFFKEMTTKDRLFFCIRRRLCFICFGISHSCRDCRSKKPCSVQGCKHWHYILLHDDAEPPVTDARPAAATDVFDANGHLVKANVFVDEGSGSTLFRDGFVRRLRLDGASQMLSVDDAGATKNNPVPLVDWAMLKTKWKHLEDLPIAASSGRVDILLGSDVIHLTTAMKTRIGQDSEPTASWTRIGLIVKRFCDTEDFGTEHRQPGIFEVNEQAIQILENGVRKLKVGYEAPITWKTGEPSLSNNRIVAENRLESLLRWFRGDSEFESSYRVAMEKNFTEGYAIVLDENENCPEYYLAHHGVQKGMKTRVVFDAAAKFQGRCINDCILSGPALQVPLPAVIIKFQEGEIAWASDIGAKFSQIRLKEEECRFFRYLWRRKGEDITRVSADFATDPEVVEVVGTKMYVNDYLSSAATVVQGVPEARGVKRALSEGDMHLQGWLSNSIEFLKAMAAREDVLTFQVGNLEHVAYTRVGIAMSETLFSTNEVECLPTSCQIGENGWRSTHQEIHKRFLWTDSSSVRNWVRAIASNYQVYVSHRVGEIQTLTETDEWRFIPGRLNPTDTATRLVQYPAQKASILIKIRTPHFGGAHESLVRSTKKAMYAALDKEKKCLRHPTDETIRTMLYEVAGLLNRRPLTTPSEDPADLRPLTPADFLNRANTASPPVDTFDDALPREHYRYLQRVLNIFWDH